VPQSLYIACEKKVPHYFELKTQLLHNFRKWKWGVRFKFVVLLFTPRKPQKRPFPRKTSGLAKTVTISLRVKCICLQNLFLFH